MTGLSTGSTLLNLACTGKPDAGFLAGKIIYLVGDSTSGKTFLSMTCCAEAVRNETFKNHRIIYDNIEDGMLLDTDRLFGEIVGDRIEPPASTEDGPVFSSTIESFYYHVDDAVDNGKPFIYILDSMDGLDSDAADSKFTQLKKAHFRQKGEAAEKIAGSYGDNKAKINSQGLRRALKGLRDTNSILIIISQTRDSLSGYGGKTHSGGRALKFYATLEIWSSVVNPIKKEVADKDREIGVRVKLEVKKNRITGRRSAVQVDIYPEYGIDDTGSLVDFLVEEGFWKITGRTIDTGLGVVGSRDKVIRKLEENNLLPKVKEQAGECWQSIIEACSLKRKPRYA